MMSVVGLGFNLFFRFIEEPFQILLIHKIFCDLLRSDCLVGYDNIGGKFGGVVFPINVTVDSSQGIGEIGSD